MIVVELSDQIERWLTEVAATHASSATVRSYRVAANSFVAYAQREDPEQLIDACLLLRYARSLNRLSPSTQHNYTGAVLRFLEYLIGEGIERGIATEEGRMLAADGLRMRVRSVLPPPPLPEAPELPDLRRLITVYDTPPPQKSEGPPDERVVLNQLRNSALLHTLFSTAGRINEVLGLDVRQVCRLDRTIVQSVEVSGKGRKRRPLLLRDHARRRLELYLGQRQQLFPRVAPLFISHGPRNAGGRLSGVTGWRIVTMAAGSYADRLRGEGADEAVVAAVETVTPHSLRHFVALYLLNEGVKLSEVAAILGHSSTTVTEQVYAAHRRSQLAETHDTFAPDPLSFDK